MFVSGIHVEYLDFPGIPNPVMAEVAMVGVITFRQQLYAQQNGLIRLNSPEINIVVRTLREASVEWVENNAAKHKVESSGIMERISKFRKQVLETHTIRSGELLDWQPEKRILGYKLPSGKNAVLIRGWNVYDEESIDASSAEVIPVNWPTKSEKISKEIAEVLGASETTYIHADREKAIQNSRGLNNLVWDFHYPERPEVYSGRDPWFVLPYVGLIFAAVKQPKYSLSEDLYGRLTRYIYQRKQETDEEHAILNDLEHDLRRLNLE